MSAKTLEIEDKSIDDAIEKACREFGVPREKLNIEIISESTGGFLGVLSKKAKIKASLLSFDMDFNLTDDPQPKSEYRIKIEPRTEPRISTQVKPAPESHITIATPAVSVSTFIPETAPELLSQTKELLSGILSRMSFE
ncbi:MAG: Jag N-terminal domain-containing protein, partial [Methylococcaceae bacterium]